MLLKMVLSLPKTVCFNLRCFPWPVARRLPVLIAYDVKVIEARKNAVVFSAPPSRFAVKIGFGGTKRVPARKGCVAFQGGKLCFEGRAVFSEGVSLSNDGAMTIGDGLYANANCTFWCSDAITLGRDAEIGWNVTLRDSDGHTVFENGEKKPMSRPIRIGDHCWLCAESHVLKGGGMGNDCVLGYRSLLTKAYEEDHILLAGAPAAPKRENIHWEK